MGHEGRITGRVYEIDFRIAMLEVGKRCIQGNLAGDGIFVVVGDRGSFIDFAPAGCGAGDVEKRAYQLRLPCVAVSNDRKVANRVGCL
jgi:hypothetical protein